MGYDQIGTSVLYDFLFFIVKMLTFSNVIKV